VEPGARSGLGICHGGAGIVGLDMAAEGNPHLVPNAPEQMVIVAARAIQQRCICSGQCEEGAIPLPQALVGRLRRYRAEHPEHEFFHDDEGNVAVVLDWNPENPEVRGAPDLETLLDELDAGPVSDLS
jgi:hypothetical protein